MSSGSARSGEMPSSGASSCDEGYNPYPDASAPSLASLVSGTSSSHQQLYPQFPEPAVVNSHCMPPAYSEEDPSRLQAGATTSGGSGKQGSSSFASRVRKNKKIFWFSLIAIVLLVGAAVGVAVVFILQEGEDVPSSDTVTNIDDATSTTTETEGSAGLLYSGVPFKYDADAGETYGVRYNYVQHGNNEEVHKGISVAECAEMCNDADWCYSFDYQIPRSDCSLSRHKVGEVGSGDWKYDPDAAYYEYLQ